MFLLQTYYFGSNQLEQHGYARRFPSRAEAEDYAQNHVAGSRHTITESPAIYCVECGAETELDCICDDLNYADGDRVVINGETYARVSE